MKYTITLNSMLLSGSITHLINSVLAAPTIIDLATFTTGSSQGYAVYSPNVGDGFTASSTRDFNGDNITDLVVGSINVSPLGRSSAGTSYVVYGKTSGYSLPINLGNLIANIQGFPIYGENQDARLGNWVNGLNDFNNDGFSDIVIGTQSSSPTTKFANYVIYGKSGGYNAPIDTAAFTSGPTGFYMTSTSGFPYYISSSAGDFNNDGFEDILVGSPEASPLGRVQAGIVYVLYGKMGGYAVPVNLDNLTPSQGFAIYGTPTTAPSIGRAVSSAGDFNNDNIDDILISTNLASPLSRSFAGTAYVLYGNAAGYAAPVDLASGLTASQGFAIYGAALRNRLGYALDKAGDFNHDGIDDIILTSNGRSASANGGLGMPSSFGQVSIIYGKTGGYNTTIIDMLNPPVGSVLTIQGATMNDGFGSSVSGLGDINNDGIDDIGIGAAYATVTSPTTRSRAGTAYVIFGQQINYSSFLDVNTLTPTQGLLFLGPSLNSRLGSGISGTGDINEDGIDDLVISGDAVTVFGGTGAGYVFYGNTSLGPVASTSTATASVSITTTPSPSMSVTPSVSTTTSVSESISQTATVTTTPSVSVTPSASISESSSQSITATPSSSLSISTSASASISTSASVSTSISQTPTVTITPSMSLTPSASISESSSQSISTTPSPSVSVTPSVSTTTSVSESISQTPTVTITPSMSLTPSASISESSSQSITATPSSSLSITPSASASISTSASVSTSISQTATVTITPSMSLTLSASISESSSQSISTTPSPSVSATPSVSASISASASVSESISQTATVTTTPSISVSRTLSKSETATPSISKSFTSTISKTPEQSSSDTPSLSISTSTLPNDRISTTPSPSVMESSALVASDSSSQSSISISPTPSLNMPEGPLPNTIQGPIPNVASSAPTSSSNVVRSATPSSFASRLSTDDAEVVEISSGSKLAPWFSPTRIVKSLLSLWNDDQSEKAETKIALNPYAQDLLTLKVKALTLKNNSEHIEDDWYRIFIEDLISDIATDLKKPESITSEVLKEYKSSLSCIVKDFSYSDAEYLPQSNFLQEFASNLGYGADALNSLVLVDQMLMLGSGMDHLTIE